MKKVLLLLCTFLSVSITLFAQPGNPSYVRGTQVCWNFNGRDHGYFRAAGNGERHILVSFTGIGENNCSELTVQSPQKLLKDNGLNWDGRTVRAPGDTIVWEVFTLLHTSGFSSATYAADIKTLFDSIQAHSPIDTGDHSRFHIQGLSAGARNIWLYLTNNGNHNSPYRHIFSTTITMSTPTFDTDNTLKSRITTVSAGKRHWVWHGSNDAHASCPPRASDTLYKYLRGAKKLTFQAGGGHNATTWDSCLSLKGSDTSTNRWKWMVTGNTPPTPVTWGPPGYVPGTQVCWTFNGRPHGYFRAAGNGERHVLVSFTTANEDTCTDYAVNAPQKWLPGTWNGKTVRAPGDTIIWEIFTMLNTNNNFMGAYASDINYFFQHIESIDTSDRRKFHAEAKSGGVNRMWGYLVNAQSHNSPYRNIFGTTISQSTGYLGSSGLLPLIRTYSPGRKHWVWYGTADGTSPAAANNQLYDSLQGTKTLTAQSGGTQGANTWDSCLSRSGTTLATNRWLWMVNGSGILRVANPATTVSVRKDMNETKAGIYPNPAHNSVLITFDEPADGYRLTVTDALGRVHKVVNNIRQPNYRLDISTLKTGIYILQLEAGKHRVQRKLVKE